MWEKNRIVLQLRPIGIVSKLTFNFHSDVTAIVGPVVALQQQQ